MFPATTPLESQDARHDGGVPPAGVIDVTVGRGSPAGVSLVKKLERSDGS